jgi:hypothetical protein
VPELISLLSIRQSALNEWGDRIVSAIEARKHARESGGRTGHIGLTTAALQGSSGTVDPGFSAVELWRGPIPVEGATVITGMSLSSPGISFPIMEM